jgi:hypothetical protein
LLLRLVSFVAALLTPLTSSPATSPVAYTSPPAARHVASPVVVGGDVSWPNCARNLGMPGRHGYALPMPMTHARFVVLGTTNGPAFTPNPCLRAQVAWARARHLPVAAYAVIHYPTRGELRRYGGRGPLTRRLARVGVAEARHALLVLRLAGVRRPAMVWVDVETVGGHPWSRSPSYNRAVLSGVLAGYRQAHVRTGIYSYASAWRRITGSLRLLHVPTWVPSGSGRPAAALAKCRARSFSGGPVLLTQWTTGRRDHDLTCPRVRGVSSLFRHP